jgi:hypothetical protein
MSHTITQNGNYQICVKITDSCNACDTIYCETININCFTLDLENLNKDDIKVFPIPIQSNLNFLNIQLNYRIEISNILGETIYNEKSFSNEYSIDIRKFQNGIYIIKVFNEFDKLLLIRKISF